MKSNSKISLKFNLWDFLYSKKLYFAAFIIPAVILFGAYAIFGVHPFGDESVLVLDLNGQYVYYYENMRDAFWGNGSLVNSWSRNFSGETVGMFAYYLASPFMLIVMLLPRAMMTESILIMQLCKVGAAGLTLCLFLKKSRKISSFPCLTFSIIYSLMSYVIVQLMNPMWLDGIILLPVICYGIEKLINENKWLWFIVPLAVIFIANFYIGWMIAFFSVLYFLAYYFFMAPETSPFKLKHFLIRGVKFGAGGILSAALASWLLIPLYKSLSLGKLDFTDPKFEWNTQFDMFDFFVNLMPNSYDTCRPEGSPVVYCGVITIILIPLFFLNNNIELKKKIGYGALGLSVLLSMYISNIDIAWHGFQVPNWLPYRYSFAFCFVLILMAVQAFERLEGITFKEIGAVIFLLTGYYFYVDKQGLENINVVFSVWYAVILTAAYGLLIYLHKKNYESRRVLVFILSVVVIENILSTVYNLFAIDIDVTYSNYSSYNQYITLGRDTVEKIYDMDDDVYRIEKNYHRTVNDAMAFGSYGISHSSSTLNAGPIQFLRKLGFSYGGHYIKYKGATYVTDSLFGIKYVMEKGSTVTDGEEAPIVERNKHYDEMVLANGDDKNIFYVYENPNALPIAYMVDNDILDTTLSGDNPFYNQNALLSGMLGQEYTNFFKKIEIDEVIPENAKLSTYGNHTKYVPEVEGKNSHIEYLVTAPTEDMVYMYFPSNYERKVNLWLNEEFVDYYYEGGNKVIQPMGHFKSGEQFSLITTITEEKKEVLFKDNLFYYLDEEEFQTVVDELKKSPLEITSFKEDHLEGNVNAEEDGVLFTTISYEPGWTIWVDGVKTESVKVCDALIGIELTKGQHTIEMKFFPAGMKLGFLISGIALFAVVLIAVYENRTKKVLLNRLYE